MELLAERSFSQAGQQPIWIPELFQLSQKTTQHVSLAYEAQLLVENPFRTFPSRIIEGLGRSVVNSIADLSFYSWRLSPRSATLLCLGTSCLAKHWPSSTCFVLLATLEMIISGKKMRKTWISCNMNCHPGLAEAKPVKLKTANWWTFSYQLLSAAGPATLRYSEKKHLQMLFVQTCGSCDHTVGP